MHPVVARKELADKVTGIENAQADRGMNAEVNCAVVETQTLQEGESEDSGGQVKELQEKLLVVEQALQIAEGDQEYQKERFRYAMEDQEYMRLLVVRSNKKGITCGPSYSKCRAGSIQSTTGFRFEGAGV